MNTSFTSGSDIEFEPFLKLVQAMRKDPVINTKIIKLLKMESYRRRFVLNRWLEQLRLRNASENLLSALSCLFDDNIAEKVLTLINEGEFKRKVKKS